MKTIKTKRIISKKQARSYALKLHQNYMDALAKEAEEKFQLKIFTEEQKHQYQQELQIIWEKAKQETMQINLFDEEKEPKKQEVEIQIIKSQLK